MRLRNVLASALFSVLCATPVFAQSVPLAQILPDLLLKGVTMQSTTQTVAGNPHEAHYIAALGQTPVPFEINKRLVSQLSTFPLGSSSAGFVFNFDTGTGLFTPASQSFGPGFAERALTSGKGRFGFGANYQRLGFQSFEGVDLENGDFAYVLQHNDCCAVAGNPSPDQVDPFFEGDLVRLSLALNVKTTVISPSLSYGVTNRWDVGVVVPVAHVSLSPSITSTIDRIATGANPIIHSWDGLGATTKTEHLSGSATGLGDVVLRTKYRVLEARGGGISGGVDLRLPTGDKENLLGTGSVQTKLSLVASGEAGQFAPHFNLGYTYSRGEISSSLTTLSPEAQPANAATQGQIDSARGTSLGGSLRLPNEVSYSAGTDFIPHPLLTLSADFVGRTQLSVQRFDILSQPYRYRVANSGPILTTDRDTFTSTGVGSLNLLLGVVGAKYNIPGTQLLLTGSVLFPMSSGGLRPKVTPVVGLDYSFKR